jgi:hypothetical protein
LPSQDTDDVEIVEIKRGRRGGRGPGRAISRQFTSLPLVELGDADTSIFESRVNLQPAQSMDMFYTWLADNVMGVDMIIMDPPWNCLTKGQGRRKQIVPEDKVIKRRPCLMKSKK